MSSPNELYDVDKQCCQLGVQIAPVFSDEATSPGGADAAATTTVTQTAQPRTFMRKALPEQQRQHEWHHSNEQVKLGRPPENPSVLTHSRGENCTRKSPHGGKTAIHKGNLI